MSVSTDGHTVKRYDQQLGDLRSLVLEMGGLVEDQIQRAVQALQDEDLGTAREVIARDHVVNGFDVRADEEVVNLLALRQPVGSDLRLILSMAKTVTDLERIGDEAQKIARMVTHIFDGSSAPNQKLLRDVAGMAKLAANMLHGALDALARMDVDRAIEIACGDEELDTEFQSALRRLVTFMMEDPRTIGHAIDVLFMIKALERIGDHAKNIAEYVVYLVKGKDVRHVSIESLSAAGKG
ncbi:phosphate signaling complex protein PhoU [Plasticicumulans acidivorans]|uniref:Phosphate-specific transport system accessory protein PhoU n=1 Tax=Plasticicumulans acidivorans TaxID=886464 RepID=A0A317MXJ2_9GAMM|nr:phosphate signaling complex protein PhoU [Plasticicumulans acidivorans]PWV63531.1 phosphate transport system protein [Plasticicumulans acidivorans]